MVWVHVGWDFVLDGFCVVFGECVVDLGYCWLDNWIDLFGSVLTCIVGYGCWLSSGDEW